MVEWKEEIYGGEEQAERMSRVWRLLAKKITDDSNGTRHGILRKNNNNAVFTGIAHTTDIIIIIARITTPLQLSRELRKKERQSRAKAGMLWLGFVWVWLWPGLRLRSSLFVSRCNMRGWKRPTKISRIPDSSLLLSSSFFSFSFFSQYR